MGDAMTIKAAKMLQSLLVHTYMSPHRKACIHTCTPIDYRVSGCAYDSRRTAIEVREEWVGRNRAG